MIGISKDALIVCCDCNKKGGGVVLIVNKKLNPKQIRIHTILEIVAVKISEPIQMIVVSVYRPLLNQIHTVVQCLDYKALSKWSINQHMIVEQ